jgi:hypothetical protein
VVSTTDDGANDDSANDDSANDDSANDDSANDDSANDDSANDDSANDDSANDDSANDDDATDDSVAEDVDAPVSSPGGTRPAVAGRDDNVDDSHRPALGSCTGADASKKARGVLGSSGSNTSP